MKTQDNRDAIWIFIYTWAEINQICESLAEQWGIRSSIYMTYMLQIYQQGKENQEVNGEDSLGIWSERGVSKQWRSFLSL